jgi:hypothetical protein
VESTPDHTDNAALSQEEEIPAMVVGSGGEYSGGGGDDVVRLRARGWENDAALVSDYSIGRDPESRCPRYKGDRASRVGGGIIVEVGDGVL